MEIKGLNFNRAGLDRMTIKDDAGSKEAACFNTMMSGGSAHPMSSGAPPGTSPSGDVTQASNNVGQSRTQQTNSDLQSAMSQTQVRDPTLFAQTMKDGQTGNGNGLVQDELQAYKEGVITKQQATDEISGAQGLANAHGGGKINGKVIGEEKSSLGTNVIHGGKTRGEQGLVNTLESFTGIGAIVKGIGNKTKGAQLDSILTAAQPALQQGSQMALQDMQDADPVLAQKFQQDGASGDGNAMVEDLVQMKNEETSGQARSLFSEADAQLLGSQIGSASKGKVSSTEDQSFTAAFGSDTLDRGSSKGAKAWNKIENTLGNTMQQLVSPVTDGVGGADQLAHGNVKGALSDFGQAAIGAASDAAMLVAPEAAPEIEMGAEAAGTAARAGLEGAGETSIQESFNLGSTLKKSSDYADNLSNIYGQASGTNNGV